MSDRRKPHLLHVFPSFGIGGAEIRFATTANRLGAKYRHTIVTLSGNAACAERLEKAVEFRIVSLTLAKSRGISLRNFRMIWQTLGDVRPDLLVTYNWGSIEWALASRLTVGPPHLHFEDGFGADESIENQRLRRVWTRRIGLGGSTQIVVPSLTLHQLALERWRVPSTRLKYIPNGIEFERFAAATTTLGLRQGGGLVIGAVGGLRREKNFARLLRAAARLETIPFRIAFAGTGTEEKALRTLAAELGLGDRVRFLGHVERPETIYPSFDVFCLSSDTEQMPYTIIEAMAAGRAIVSTDVGDIKSMVADENRGYIVPVDDEAAYARALAVILSDRELRRRIGNANQQRAREAFELAKMISSYDILFTRLCDGRGTEERGSGDATP